MPQASHRICGRHLFSNFRAKFPRLKLRNYFWAACRAYTEAEFKSAMRDIQLLSSEAHDWLMTLPLK